MRTFSLHLAVLPLRRKQPWVTAVKGRACHRNAGLFFSPFVNYCRHPKSPSTPRAHRSHGNVSPSWLPWDSDCM